MSLPSLFPLLNPSVPLVLTCHEEQAVSWDFSLLQPCPSCYPSHALTPPDCQAELNQIQHKAHTREAPEGPDKSLHQAPCCPGVSCGRQKTWNEKGILSFSCLFEQNQRSCGNIILLVINAGQGPSLTRKQVAWRTPAMLPASPGPALTPSQPTHAAGRCSEGDRLMACQLHPADAQSAVPKPPPSIAQVGGCSQGTYTLDSVIISLPTISPSRDRWDLGLQVITPTDKLRHTTSLSCWSTTPEDYSFRIIDYSRCNNLHERCSALWDLTAFWHAQAHVLHECCFVYTFTWGNINIDWKELLLAL